MCGVDFMFFGDLFFCFLIDHHVRPCISRNSSHTYPWERTLKDGLEAPWKWNS